MDAEEWSPLPRPKMRVSWGELLRRRLPIVTWAPQYERTSAVADLIAGVTLGLTLVPQSIAYASLANLPVQYGLYSAFVGTILYMFLGTVKQVSIGPTSLMALLTLHTCRDLPIDYVVLLTFLSGCIVFLMGLLKLSFLVDLISPSVTSGFTSATAAIIVIAQLKGLLGLKFVAETPAENLYQIAGHWRDVRIPDVAMSLVCCSILLSLRKLKEIPVNEKRFKLRKALWLVSISRNALVVCLASAVAYHTYNPNMPLFKLSGRVEPGLPMVRLPSFSVTTNNQTVGFAGMVEHLGFGLILLPIVMVLANIAIAKAFSKSGHIDATQEMLALGLCNCAGALFRAMPTCGAFTRSAVSQSSGVRTPAAGLYSGIITLLALNYLTEYFFFIPKACLSSVLVCAVVFLIDLETPLCLWRARRREVGVVGITFAVGVFVSVEAAVLCGVLAELAGVMRDLLRPMRVHQLDDKWCGRRVVRVQVRRVLLYVNAERLAARVRTLSPPPLPHCTSAPPIVLLDCSALALVDHTALKVIERLVKEFEERRLVVYNASGDAARVLRQVPGISERILRERSARRALRLAQPERGSVSADSRDSTDKPLRFAARSGAAETAILLHHEHSEAPPA